MASGENFRDAWSRVYKVYFTSSAHSKTAYILHAFYQYKIITSSRRNVLQLHHLRPISITRTCCERAANLVANPVADTYASPRHVVDTSRTCWRRVANLLRTSWELVYVYVFSCRVYDYTTFAFKIARGGCRILDWGTVGGLLSNSGQIPRKV